MRISNRLRRLRLLALLGTGLPVLGLGVGCEFGGEREEGGERSAAADSSTSAGMVDVGGHRLAVQVLGKGSPTVVIDPGLGETWEEWESLAERISDRAAVCLYNRAGYGRSEPGPFPRTASRETGELRALLEKAGLEPPFVLVGHSLGGLNALVFTRDYPEVTGGLVLLDPPPKEFMAGRRFPELKTMAGEQSLEYRRGAKRAREAGDSGAAAFLDAVASEHEMFLARGASEIEGILDLNHLPLVVLASGKPNPAFGDSAEAFQAFWIESNRALSMLSTRGRFRLVARSTHALHRDEPAVVLQAILEVVDEVRGDAGPAIPR
jgi:pimeloyl-ACP methyl ester carboxylesterase